MNEKPVGQRPEPPPVPPRPPVLDEHRRSLAEAMARAEARARAVLDDKHDDVDLSRD